MKPPLAALAVSVVLLCAPLALAATPPAFAADLLRDSARAHALQARWDDAERQLERAATLAGPDDPRRQLQIQLELARVLASRATYKDQPFEPALATAQSGLERARELADPALLAEGLLTWAITHYNHQFRVAVPDYVPMRKALTEALPAFERSRDPRGQAEALFYLGLAHERLDERPQARATYERALAIAQPAGDALMQAYLYRHLADFQKERHGLAGVLDFHQRCLRLREEIGFATGIVFASLAVGETLVEMKQPEQARPHYQRALEVARRTGVARGEAYAQAGLAGVDQAVNKPAGAREHAREALAAAARSQDVDLMGQVLESVTPVLAPARP